MIVKRFTSDDIEPVMLRLSVHVVRVNCQYCHDTGEHQFIVGQHKKECPKLSLPCPNNCEVGNIPRERIGKHIDVHISTAVHPM